MFKSRYGYSKHFCLFATSAPESGNRFSAFRTCSSEKLIHFQLMYLFSYRPPLSNFFTVFMLKIIAGLLEHRLGESLATQYNQPLLAGLLSFVARTVNSYLGTQVGHFIF